MKNYYFDNSKALRPFTFEAEANAQSEAPSNALRVAPEFKDGFWPCEKKGKWVLVEDHRHETVYSTETGEIVEVKEVGVLSDKVTAQPKPDEYHAWNGKKWVMTDETKSQKEEDEHLGLVNQAKQTLIETNQQIEILEDRISFIDYSSDNELAEIQNELQAWKKYRIELNKFIRGDIPNFPRDLI